MIAICSRLVHSDVHAVVIDGFFFLLVFACAMLSCGVFVRRIAVNCLLELPGVVLLCYGSSFVCTCRSDIMSLAFCKQDVSHMLRVVYGNVR